MITIESEEARREREEKTRKYKESGVLQDQICGILLDVSIGNLSLLEPVAKAKAEAIAKLMSP